MQTLTLSESVFKPNLETLRSNPPKKLNYCSSISSNNSHSPNHKFICLNRNPNLLSFRYPKRWFQYADKRWTQRVAQISKYDLTDVDIRCQSHQKFEGASGLLHDHDLGVNEKSSKEVILRNEDCKSAPFKHEISAASETTVHDWLKFSMFFCFLTLQDSQQALAASTIANGLQSMPFLGDIGDISTGFASAFLLIFFSELGDKTFFIAALLAARNSGATVFVGTFGALAVMTVISVVLGRTFHYIDDLLPFRFGEMDVPIDDIAAVCLLVYFGLSTLIEASSSDGLKTEEEQKEAELAVSEFSGNGAGIVAAAGTVISTFLLVFVAEWGDKSFFSTIALAAASSPLGVVGGALAGHAAATLLAVLGGSLLGTFLSEKVIAYVGGSLFLVFAAVTLVEIIS